MGAYGEQTHCSEKHKTFSDCIGGVSFALISFENDEICFFEDNETILRYLWYLYYIPMTAVPLLSFFCSLCVGKTDADRPLVKWWRLWIVWTILVIGITTNDVHQLAFRFTGDVKAYESYTYGLLYFAAVIWSVSLAIISFVILMRKCRLSQCRQLAWIPMLPFTIAAVLLIIYYIQGGSPAIHGHRLYKLQEVYISADKDFCMTIMLDALDTNPDTEKYMTKLNVLNGTLAVKNEDGAVYIRLSFGEGAVL